MRFYVPEGKTIFIRAGAYRFVGPMWVKKDKSFRWPENYTDGTPIDYNLGVTNGTFENSDLRNGSQIRDMSVHEHDGRGETSEGLPGGSDIREPSRKSRRSSKSSGEQTGDGVFGSIVGGESEIQDSSNETPEQDTKE